MDTTIKDVTTEELAHLLAGLRETARELRDRIWTAEREIEDRLSRSGAKWFKAEGVKINLATNRVYKWDTDTLTAARTAAEQEGRLSEFDAAFPLIFDPKVRKADELVKFGGQTAQLIEMARTVEERPAKVEVEVARAVARDGF